MILFKDKCGDPVEYYEGKDDEELNEERQQLGQQRNEDKIGECGKQRKKDYWLDRGLEESSS